MSIARLLTRPCTITHVTQDDTNLDDYGNPTETSSTVTTVCYLEPYARTGSSEADIDRATTEDDHSFFVAADTVLASTDSVTVDGEDGTFEVFGNPTSVWNPRLAAVSHIEARLRRTTR